MTDYFRWEIECAPIEQIRAWQEERLLRQVEHAYHRIPYYHDKMEEQGVTPEDIRSLKDLDRLPLLNLEDLTDTYPYGMLAVPLAETVCIQTSSFTITNNAVAFYTKNDISLWNECCARAIVAAGGTKEDVIQVSYGYGLFSGASGMHGGSYLIGALALPMSSGDTRRQIQFMCDFGSTMLCCTPSFAEYLAENIDERGLKKRIKLKAGMFGLEPWDEDMRNNLENGLGIKAYQIYGPVEICGPGIAYECSEQDGMHLNEDHFIAEVIDPQAGTVLPEGEVGELVLTCLTKEAFPLLRYRTGDICTLSRKPCACGRTHVKIFLLQTAWEDDRSRASFL